jgi:copper chaperone NosL
MKNFFLFLLTISFFTSCKVTPKEIQYGQDHCHLCDMTVVDSTHASEYTTKKGRSYPFDSEECLIWKLQKDNNEKDMAYILVADYNHPGKLIDAKSAFYLISEKIKSPMGANLSAFSSKEDAQKAQKQYGGKIYDWNQIKAQLAK